MYETAARRLPMALAGLAITAGLLAWLLAGGITGARADSTFTSPLANNTINAAKGLEPGSAPYTVSATAVRSTTVAAERRQLQTAVVAPKKKAAIRRKASVAAANTELATAKSLLASQIAKHPILAGTTIEFGDARGYQAVSYYRTGRIVISRTHTASLSRIVAHEVWHVIDWRDNGRIDWGENVPR